MSLLVDLFTKTTAGAGMSSRLLDHKSGQTVSQKATTNPFAKYVQAGDSQLERPSVEVDIVKAKLKKQGYKIYTLNDQTLIEDSLGHKTFVNKFYMGRNGVPSYVASTLTYVAPSQRERVKRHSLGYCDTPEELARYRKQAVEIMKKAGYKIYDRYDGTSILTAPDGTTSKVRDITISIDGGADWTTIPEFNSYGPGRLYRSSFGMWQ